MHMSYLAAYKNQKVAWTSMLSIGHIGFSFLYTCTKVMFLQFALHKDRLVACAYTTMTQKALVKNKGLSWSFANKCNSVTCTNTQNSHVEGWHSSENVHQDRSVISINTEMHMSRLLADDNG